MIVTELNKHGVINKAAQHCVALVVNGYSDWFLPSIDELHLMYVNLHKKGLGGFEDWYWSLSQYLKDYAWYQNFNSGYQVSTSWSITCRVRAVRAF